MAKKFTKSSMLLSEARKVVAAGNLEERTPELLLEIKGIYNKTTTILKDEERIVDKSLQKKAKVSPAGIIKQLDFDTITMSGEFKEESKYALTIPLATFISRARAISVAEATKYTQVKHDRKVIFGAFVGGTMAPDLRKYVKESKSVQFSVERTKKDPKKTAVKGGKVNGS